MEQSTPRQLVSLPNVARITGARYLPIYNAAIAGAFGTPPERIGGRWYLDTDALSRLAVYGPTPAIGEVLGRLHRNGLFLLQAADEAETRRAAGLTLDALAGHIAWLRAQREELLAQLEADRAEARDRRDTNLATCLDLILALLPAAAYGSQDAHRGRVTFSFPGAIPAPAASEPTTATQAPHPDNNAA